MSNNISATFSEIPAADQQATCGGMSPIGSTLPRPRPVIRSGGSSGSSSGSKPKNATESTFKPVNFFSYFGFRLF